MLPGRDWLPVLSFRRLDHVQLPIPPGAAEDARAFYGGVLGLEPIQKPDSLRDRGGLWYRAGDAELHLGIEDPSGSTRRHPAFEVADLDAAREHLRSAGVEIHEETPIPGRERFSFRDPFGNRIELLAYD